MICICPICGGKFKNPPSSHRKTCSRGCGLAFKRTPEYRKQLSDLQKNDWSVNRKIRQIGIDKMTATKRTEEGRARQAAENRRRWADPEYRERVVRAVTEAENKPECVAFHRARMIQQWQNLQWRSKCSISMRGHRGLQRKTRDRMIVNVVQKPMQLEAISIPWEPIKLPSREQLMSRR